MACSPSSTRPATSKDWDTYGERGTHAIATTRTRKSKKAFQRKRSAKTSTSFAHRQLMQGGR